MVEGLGARLLRRTVGELALYFETNGLGQALHRVGDAKVRDTRCAVNADEQVLRADVAVHDSKRFAQVIRRGVRVVKSARALFDDRRHGRDRKLASLAPSEDRRERRPHNEIHHDVERAVRLFTQVKGRDDIRAVNVCRDLGLIEEHAPVSLVAADLWEHSFERDELLKAHRADYTRGVHRGHSARRDLTEDLVASIDQVPGFHMGQITRPLVDLRAIPPTLRIHTMNRVHAVSMVWASCGMNPRLRLVE